MPFCAFAAFACIAIFPCFRRCDPQVAHFASIREIANLGVAAQIPDQNYLVYGSCHSTLLRILCLASTLHHSMTMNKRLNFEINLGIFCWKSEVEGCKNQKLNHL